MFDFHGPAPRSRESTVLITLRGLLAGPVSDDLVDQLVELQARRARLEAEEARLLAAVAGAHAARREFSVIDPVDERERALVIVDEVREEVAAALHRAPGRVHDDIVIARLLTGPLTQTLTALEQGRISGDHARAIAREARRISTSWSTLHQEAGLDSATDAADRVQFTEACARLQERVLPVAQKQSVGRTRTLARRVVASLDRAGEERRRRTASASIDVTVTAEGDGLGLVLARLPMVDAARVASALDAAARQAAVSGSAPCDVTPGQLRARALVDAVCGRGGLVEVGVEVQVVVDLPTLLALQDAPAAVLGRGCGAGEPVTVEAIRTALADPATPASLRRLVADDLTGHLLDRGRRAYAVSDAQRAFLASRDRTCRFPGCSCPASRCQADHAVPWDEGGPTDLANLGLLCTRHHQLKTHAGWEIADSDGSGRVTWRSPAGRSYVVDPPPVHIADPPPSEPSPPESASEVAADPDLDPPPF